MQQELPPLFPIPTLPHFYITRDARVYGDGGYRGFRELKSFWIKKCAGSNMKMMKLYDKEQPHKKFNSYSLFRLFALTFVPNPNACRYAIAKDSDYSNITIENVLWSDTNRDY